MKIIFYGATVKSFFDWITY